jgi:tetratricopeptide (TPR) repeat protein
MPDPSLVLSIQDKLHIFVSSTIEECSPERRAAADGIRATNHEPVLFERLGARSHPPRALYLSRLRQSQIVVAIYRDNYGAIDTQSGMTISGVEDEFRHARLWGLPLLVYVRRDASRREDRLKSLVAEIMSGGLTISFYDEPAQLTDRVKDDVTSLVVQRFLDAEAQDAVLRQSSTDTLTAVSRALGAIVPRIGALNALRNVISQRNLTCVTGPAGIGKTVLLAQLSHQDSHPIVFADRLAPKELFGVLTNKLRDLSPEHALQFATLDAARAAFVSAWAAVNHCTLLIDASPHLDVIRGAIGEAGGFAQNKKLVYSSRKPPNLHDNEPAVFQVPSLSADELSQLVTATGAIATTFDVAELLRSTGGNPLLVRQQLLRPGISVAQTWQALSPSAREIATYLAITGSVLTVADLLALRGDPAYGSEHLVDDLDEMPTLVNPIGAGFQVAHEQVRDELLTVIKSKPQRHQFAASRLGRYFVDQSRVVEAYFLLREARNPDARNLLKEAAFEAARSGDQKASVRVLQDLAAAQATDRGDRAIYTVLALAQAYEIMGEITLAREHLTRADTMLRSDSNDDVRISVREAVISFEARRDLTPQHLDQLRQLKEEMRAAGRDWQSARIAIELSVCLINAHDPLGAEREAREALQVFETLDDRYGIDVARRNLASALTAQPGKEEEADTLIRAVEQEVGPESSRRHRAWLCNLLVRRHRQAGRFAEAQARAEEAIAIAHDLGDELLVAINLISLANVYTDMGLNEKGIETYKSAATAGQRCARRDVEAHASYLIASTYNSVSSGVPDSARAPELAELHARHAIALLRGTVVRDHLCRALHELGDSLQVQRRKREAAEAYFEEASILLELNMLDRFEVALMTAAYITARDDVQCYARGLRTVFHLPEPASDDAPTLVRLLFSPLSALFAAMPRETAIAFFGLHFAIMFEQIPDMIARHLFERIFELLFKRRSELALTPWRVVYPGLVLCAAAARVLTRQDVSRVTSEIARTMPGLYARTTPDGGTHWLVILNLPAETAITITPLDNEKDSELACLLIALFLKGFEGEMAADIFAGIPLRSELVLAITDIKSAPQEVQDEVRPSLGDRPCQVSRPTDMESDDGSMPTYIFLSTGFSSNVKVGEGKGGPMQILFGFVIAEVAYRLMRGQVDLEVITPKLVELVRRSTS